MSSSSKVSQPVTTTTQNQQVGASEGSVSAGAGATVNIQQLGGEVTRDALSAVVEQGKQSANVANAAIRGSGDAVTAIRGTAGDALSTVERSTQAALGFGSDSVHEVFDFGREILAQSERTQQNATQFASKSQELIAAQAGVTSPAAVGDTIGQFVRLVAIGGAIAGAVFLFRKKSA